MAFRCRMCGTCCMYMGDCITIDRQIGPFSFECESVSTGTAFIAVVDEDKREIFLDRTWIEGNPRACPFLRPSGEKILCTIHGTRPVQCRFYRCVVMRVLDLGGPLIGKVTGTLALHSDDLVLRRIWESALKDIPENIPDTEDRLGRILEDHGYRVE